ncbi:MAG TPA: endonuclease/exonuclease/phosphatase family protein [Gaiellaceae bacterium]
MPLVVRTWNLFHGNATPPERRAYLRAMVELVTADRPDVVCLQEVPVWAVSQLGRWSGMAVTSAVARRPRLGSAELGRRVTDVHHGRLRSALTGEADAMLISPKHRFGDERSAVMSTRPLRRIAHSVRLDDDMLLANFHIGGDEAQWEAVGEFVKFAERVVLAGDANIRGAWLHGFSLPLVDSIDQILVRGLPSTPPVRWPDERRRLDGRLLSDHAPVELTVG